MKRLLLLAVLLLVLPASAQAAASWSAADSSGPTGLKIVVGHDVRRDTLTLRCVGRGVAHLRILSGSRVLARATCTGRDTVAHPILAHPPVPLLVAITV